MYDNHTQTSYTSRYSLPSRGSDVTFAPKRDGVTPRPRVAQGAPRAHHTIALTETEEAGGAHFDHKLQGKLVSIDTIKTIDADFVRTNYITVQFCKFVYEYSGVVSRTKTDFKELMFSSEEVSVFDIVGESDISWSLTMYVSGKENWLYKYHESLRARRLKAVRDQLAMPALPPPPPPPARGTRRNRGGQAGAAAQAVTDNEEQALPSEDDVPPNPFPAVKPRWTSGSQSGKSKYDCGLSKEGKVFYVTMKKALKEVDNGEWSDVWDEFWEEQKKIDVPAKKRNPASENGGKDECFGEDFVMDELVDEEEDDYDMDHLM